MSEARTWIAKHWDSLSPLERSCVRALKSPVPLPRVAPRDKRDKRPPVDEKRPEWNVYSKLDRLGLCRKVAYLVDPTPLGEAVAKECPQA